MRRALLFSALLALAGCGGGTDPGLVELSERLVEATPEDQRTTLDADLAALARLDRDARLGAAEKRALFDLYRSAMRDGALNDDERVLLTRFARDLVAGAGRLKGLRSTDTGGST